MKEAIQLVGPVERLLYLRSLPNLSHLSAEDAARLAQSASERYFKRGSMLSREGEPTTHIYLLVEGKVSVMRNGLVLDTIEPPFGVGFLALLAADARGVSLRAEENTLALEISADTLLDEMEEQFHVLQNALRQLSGQMVDAQRRFEGRGILRREAPVETRYPEQPLDLVQRLALLSKQRPYAHASLDSLADLARRSSELRLEPGDELWGEGDESNFGFTVVHGSVLCESSDGERSFRMGPGSVVGYLESLAGRPRGYRAHCETRVVALKNTTEAFFDTLEDNAALGLSFASFLARTLLDLLERSAEAQEGA